VDQRLWKCVNRYRVRTEVDYILEDAMPCRAEVEGTICYSHIAGPVEGDELKELNDNRRAKEMSTINQTFCALSLYDARLVGEENEKNSMFRKSLYERIRMHEGRGQQYDNMLHLLFWHFEEDLKVCELSDFKVSLFLICGEIYVINSMKLKKVEVELLPYNIMIMSMQSMTNRKKTRQLGRIAC